MQIGSVHTATQDGAIVARARITWDDVDRPPLEATVERPDDGSTEPVPVECFLAGAAVIADLHGERTIAVADPVDPALVSNLTIALDTLRTWFGSSGPPVHWETTSRIPAAPSPDTGFLMTGGVDSSALLIDNHERYPAGHPRRIGTGIVVYGLDPSTAGDLRRPDDFLVRLAAATGITLAPVATNLRALDPAWTTWQRRAQMAILTGAAHGAGAGIGHLLVAASDHLGDLLPYGTHPQLDQSFSSTALQVHHEVVHLTRDQRMALVAASPAALASLQVCNQARTEWLPGGLNCGRCEKCLRTLVSLRAAGIAAAPTLPRPPVTAADIDALHFDPVLLINWSTPEELAAGGEAALAASVRRLPRRLKVDHALRRARWHGQKVVERLRPGRARSGPAVDDR